MIKDNKITKITKSAKGTSRLGFWLAKQILKEGPGKRGRVLALVGELGSGKTTFLQGFAKGLGVKEKILSPTFIVMKRFKIKDLRFKSFYHFDCYRIDGARELYGLGWKEIIKDPKAIIVVEWADRARKTIPEDALWIKFSWRTKNERRVIII